LWSRYLAETREATQRLAADLLGETKPQEAPEVALTDYDPEGETKLVASILYEVSRLPEAALLHKARQMGPEERRRVISTYVGERRNRRHKPGRAFERVVYRFDILSDYGAFRDLQRHRMLTIQWQTLTVDHGFVLPEEVESVGAARDWRRVMEAAAVLHEALRNEMSHHVASYAVPMAYRIRYAIQMNAREAMHMLELRTSPQGHPAYRRICQEMYRLIAEVAGHRAVAEAMRFVDLGPGRLGRLEAEARGGRRGEERIEGS
jgi:hypothetical protein